MPHCARLRVRVLVALAGLVMIACGKSGGPRYASSAGPIERPKGPLSQEQGQAYLLALVNYDRGEHDLGPVEWDEVAALAARRHVDDMVKHGFTGHWGTDGSVPEERYTDAGGSLRSSLFVLFQRCQSSLDRAKPG